MGPGDPPDLPPCTEAEGLAFFSMMTSLPAPAGHPEATFPEVAPPPVDYVPYNPDVDDGIPF